jgi:hypothetical protein
MLMSLVCWHEHEKNGQLFEAGDVAGLSAALKRLGSNRQLLQQLAANAIEPKLISDYVSELQIIYDSVLAERGGEK